VFFKKSTLTAATAFVNAIGMSKARAAPAARALTLSSTIRRLPAVNPIFSTVTVKFI